MIRLRGASGVAEPLPNNGTLKLYVCGVTPYDAAHLGHVATFLTYDVLLRRLDELGTQARYVRNITDLDDPILPKAQQLDVAYDDLVESEIAQFQSDMRALGLLIPDEEPRVSEMIDEVLEYLDDLITAGVTYQVNDTIYFDTSKATDFGTLSGYDSDLQRHYANERGGDPDHPDKRSPFDFVLWRPARDGEPVVPSRNGHGMPGWHVGCSAMARALLGETIDLHGGGIDLIYPHHECENAQSMALQDKPFVRRWHHCEFVRYQGNKMSKSLGNTVFARDLLKHHDPCALRLAVLRLYCASTGLDWRDRDIVQGERLLALVREAARAPAGPDPRPWATRAREAIDDDLDFPSAVAELEDLARAILSGGDDAEAPTSLRSLAHLLGVDPAPSDP